MTSRFRCCLLLLALVAVGHAQDLTVCNPIWRKPLPPPDRLPSVKSRVDNASAAAMERVSHPSYLLVWQELRADGRIVSSAATGTHLPLEREFQAGRIKWEFVGAREKEQPAAGEVWVPVIFNPASAALGRPDATPRLLGVSPVFLDQPLANRDRRNVVDVTVQVDAAGTVTGVGVPRDVDPRNAEVIEASVKGWRFAAARKSGQPVAAETPLTVLCFVRPADPAVRDAYEKMKYDPPTVVRRARATYPVAAERFGVSARVLVRAEVNADGTLRNVYIQESENPIFDESALAAARKTTFRPARRDGVPVEGGISLPFTFEAPNASRYMFSIREEVDQSKLPPELRYDKPPKLRSVHFPVHPFGLRSPPVAGTVKLVFRIGETGQVIAVEVQETPQPELGAALTAAVEAFKFDPALRKGRPVQHLLAYQHEFILPDQLDPRSEELLRIELNEPHKILGASSLDRPVVAVTRRPGKFPVTVRPEVKEGEAVVECLIDHDGRVRLPRITRASEPAFGYAAVQAASGWWFEPPTAGGQPVLARVRLPFRFRDEERAIPPLPGQPIGP